jgi:hypothetical protein
MVFSLVASLTLNVNAVDVKVSKIADIRYSVEGYTPNMQYAIVDRSDNGIISIWNIEKDIVKDTDIKADTTIRLGLWFSPDSKTAIVINWSELYIIDLISGEALKIDNGEYLINAKILPLNDRVLIFDVDYDKCAYSYNYQDKNYDEVGLAELKGDVYYLTYNLFADVDSKNYFVNIRNVETFEIIERIDYSDLTIYRPQIYRSQVGKYFVISSDSSSSALYSLSDFTRIKSFNVGGSASFTQNDDILVIGNMFYCSSDGYTSANKIEIKDDPHQYYYAPNDYLIDPAGKYLYTSNAIYNAKPIMHRLKEIKIVPQSVKINTKLTKQQNLSLKGIYVDGTEEVITDDVKWVVGDFSFGQIEGNVLRISGTGKNTLTASYMGLNAQTEIIATEAPVKVKATKTADGNQITWDGVNSVDGFRGYLIYRALISESTYSVTPINDFPTMETKYIDTNVEQDQDYKYVVTALFDDLESARSNEASTKITDYEIKLQIGNQMMTINGEQSEIDPGIGTKPINDKGRTLLPIRSIIEAIGGTITWIPDEKRVLIQLDNQQISLKIGENKAYVNGIEKVLDVPAKIVSGRTMIPLRFVSENLGCKVDWDGNTKTATIRYTKTK